MSQAALPLSNGGHIVWLLPVTEGHWRRGKSLAVFKNDCRRRRPCLRMFCAVAVAVMEIFTRAVMEKDWSRCTVRCVVLVSLIWSSVTQTRLSQSLLDFHLITPLLESFIHIIDCYVMSGWFNHLNPAGEIINHLNHFTMADWCQFLMQHDMCFHFTWLYCSTCWITCTYILQVVNMI